MNNYKTTIGIEVHVELKTNKKIFSPSNNKYGSLANSNVNLIDLGYPGTLPQVNKEAVILGIKACHVLNLNINKHMHFDRKNYFYPDNSKNFQITQFNTPIGTNGFIEITKSNGDKKKIYIHEAHLEEDTCKSVHGKESSLLDFNRSGVPLLEIVTEPCIESAEEAVLYLEKLKELLLYSDVSDCKIEEGSMRCDANISISNTDKLGTKVEIKNIGSITNVGLAINYEEIRQAEELDNGHSIIEETRRYDDNKNITISMRVKEKGNDYRYFPEPDIPFINLTDEFINETINGISTMPDSRRLKYIEAGINEININKIIQNKDVSDYLERFNNIDLVIGSNLLLGDIQGYLNKNNKKIEDTKLSDSKFIDLVNKLKNGDISNKIFKDILNDIMENDSDIETILKDKGISLVNDLGLVKDIILKVLNDNSNMVNDYKGGNERAAKGLMGQVMKESKGSINPSVANKLLMEILNEK